MRAVQHQRLADLAAVDHGFEGAIAFIVRAHEADLHQAFAESYFGIDDLAAAFGGDRQGFFAEHRFAGGDGGQHEFFVARAPGGDEDRFDLG
ncbi:hypothetical protein PS708_01997 [Pseudomonas fluorescens]|nr:hypothetical protein PS708_01997 [Pseudomonas fluorescens]